MEISQEIQQQLAQFQQLEEQLQAFAAQRAQMELQLRDISNTLEKLKDVEPDTPMYQNIGSVLIRVKDKSALMEELQERKESLYRRVESMKMQEERLKKRLESMGNELNQKLQGAGLA